MNASELFVRALENEGVGVVYGVPGEENLDLLEAIRKSSIELIVTRHEQGAGFMAATYGRLTGKVGVCLSTLGPGATNLVTAAAYAQLGAFPMMMITGQKPIKKSKQGQFQIVDVVRMMEPLTKYSRQIVNVNRIASTVREAFRIAQEERPGAVHLEFPEDVAAEEVEGEMKLFQVSHARRPEADDKVIREAAKMIKEAEYPLLLVGAGANRKLVRKALSEFIEETGAYFFNTQMGKGVVDEHNIRFLGTAALSENDYIHCAIDRSDLVINVGHDVVEKPPFFMEHNGGRKVIHINFNSAIVDNVYFPQQEVVGDISSSIFRLTREVGTLEKDFSYFKRVRENLCEHLQQKTSDSAYPLKPQRIVADVRRVMPDDGVVAMDNGMYKIWFARNYLASEPNSVLLDNALASMGAGLPSAMEVARIYPSRRVMSVNGDGGFMMNSQELETAVRLGLNLVILVLNDSAYGMIRWKQYSMGFEDYGLEFANPDFVKFAESFGIHGHRVEKTDDFRPLLESCFDSGGIHLIDVPVDYSENNRVLVDELKEKICLI